MEDQKTLQRQPQVATSDGLAACPNCEEMGDHQEIEHQVEGSRVSCDCGVCGSWEVDYDAAVAAWNHLAARCAANAGTQRPGTSDAEFATRTPMPGSLE